VARVVRANNNLQIEINGSIFALQALTANQFVPVGFPADMRLTFDLVRPIPVMKVAGDRMRATDWPKIREAQPSADELAAYAGDYRSDELAVVYSLRIVEGKLRLVKIADRDGIPRTGMSSIDAFRPTTTDEFEIGSQGIIVHFLRDRKARVAGFELGAGGTPNIAFSRIL